MQYFYTNQEGIKEEVQPERWQWRTVYDDGTELKQFGDDGVFHRIGEVDQDRTILFMAFKPGNPAKRIDILLPRGARLIHKYRNFVFDFGGEEKHIKVYIFGYKHGDHYHYNFILPDDRIVQGIDENPKLTDFKVA